MMGWWPRWFTAETSEAPTTPAPKQKTRRQPTCRLCRLQEGKRIPLKSHRCPYRDRAPSPRQAPTVPLTTTEEPTVTPSPPTRPQRAAAPSSDAMNISLDLNEADSSYEEEEEEGQAFHVPEESPAPLPHDDPSPAEAEKEPPRKVSRITGKRKRTVRTTKNDVALISIPLERLFVSDISLGQGSYGYVRKGRFDGADVAVKFVHSDKLEEEAHCMQNLRHPNILPYYGVCLEEKFLVLELCDGDLEGMMDQLTPSQVISISIQVAYGIHYLHQENITHRDLKPANILMKDGVPKLADFGISKQIVSVHNTKIGTPYYMAPEILQGHYGPAIDIYAFSLIMFEMMSQQRLKDVLFRDMDPFKVFEVVKGGKQRPVIPQSWNSRPRRLLRSMWHSDSTKRPTILEVISSLEALEEDDFPLKKKSTSKSKT